MLVREAGAIVIMAISTPACVQYLRPVDALLEGLVGGVQATVKLLNIQ